MTLRELMVHLGYADSEDASKCRCPFHSGSGRNGFDVHPSAYLNDNSIYCFVCVRTYTLKDFYYKYHIYLDYVNTEGEQLKRLRSLHSEDLVLFSYPFEKNS
jgi:hypothetical protein